MVKDKFGGTLIPVLWELAPVDALDQSKGVTVRVHSNAVAEDGTVYPAIPNSVDLDVSLLEDGELETVWKIFSKWFDKQYTAELKVAEDVQQEIA